MKGCRFQTWLLLVVSGFFLSPLFWTTFGCGGSTVTQSARAATAPTVDITGTVTIPTTITAALISALDVRGMKNATTDSAGSGLTCAGFTLEGEELGEATSDTTGTFTLAAGVDALKPTDATTTSWTAKFYIQCTDANGKYDIRNYCEASVDETSTTSISCSADPDTTLTTMDLLSKSGCTIGASCSMAGVDPICFMEVQKTAYRAANTTDGTGVEDDMGSVKELSRLCMAATTPAALGFNSPEVMIGAIQSGSLTSAQLDQCGASSAQKDKFAAGAKAVMYLRDIFYSNIAGGSGISASLSLQMKSVQAETGSACDMAKSDSTYASNLVATYGKAKDPSELETMKNASNLDKTILSTMAQYCPNSVCDFSKFKPGVLTGTLSGCGMDPKACGFTDADGNLQDVFGKMRLTMDSADKAGVGEDFDKLRNLGASFGAAFVAKGISTVAADEQVANRTAQLFGSNIGSQGGTYDPTKAGETFGTYQTTITGSGGTALDTCLASATTDATRIACYSTGTTTSTAKKANAESCTAGTECSSGICVSGFCASNSLPPSFTLSTGNATANTCATPAASQMFAITISTQSDSSFTTPLFSGTKLGSTFTAASSPTSTTSAGCTFSSFTGFGGVIAPLICSGYSVTMTVTSGNCLSMIGSNTPGVSCVQTYASASCTTP